MTNKMREYIRRFIEDALVHSQRNRSPDDGIDLDQEPTNAGSTDTIAGDFGMGGNFGAMNNIWEWWSTDAESPDTMETKENEPTWMQPEWMHDDTHSPGDIWKTASGMYGGINQAGEIDYFDNSRMAQDYVDGPQQSTNIFPNVQPGAIPLQRNAGVEKSPTGVPLTSPDVRDFPSFDDIEDNEEGREELDQIAGEDGPLNQTPTANTFPYVGLPDFNQMDPRFYDFNNPVNLDKEQVEKPEYLPMSNPPHEPDDYHRSDYEEDPHVQTGTGHEFPDEKYWTYPKDYPKEQEEPQGDFSPPSSEEMDAMYREWLRRHPEETTNETGSKINPNLARTVSGIWVAKHPRTGQVQHFGPEDDLSARLYAMGQDNVDDNPVSMDVHKEGLSYQLSDYLDAILNERNYRNEYDRYQGTPEQKKRRAMRNKVRREALRKGEVKKGDGVDIHHKDHNTFNDNDKNLKKLDQGTNRSDNLHHPGEKMEVSDDSSSPGNNPRSTWTKPHTAPHYHKPSERQRQKPIEKESAESKDEKITKILLLALLKTIIAERQKAANMSQLGEELPTPFEDDTDDKIWKGEIDPFNDRERFGGSGFQGVPLPKKSKNPDAASQFIDVDTPSKAKKRGWGETTEPTEPKKSPEDQAAEDERQRHEEDKARIRDILFRASGDQSWQH